MSAIIDRIRSEPVLLTGLVQAVITLAVTFGLNLTVDQIGSILTVTTAALAIFARSKVTPV